jgi:hypothetical protein
MKHDIPNDYRSGNLIVARFCAISIADRFPIPNLTITSSGSVRTGLQIDTVPTLHCEASD